MNPPEISLQLWSVREELSADPDDTLAKVKSAGFNQVEAFGFVDRVKELASGFERHGLTSPTAHASLTSRVENPFDSSIRTPESEEVFAAAAALGVATVIDPFVVAERWQSLDEIKKTAARLNEAAAVAARFGITVGYHNHSQEFVFSIGGRYGLEVFADLLEPHVVLELDVYWAAAAGVDVIALIHRLNERIFALHVKDGSLEPTPSIDTVPSDQVPAGNGVVPLTESLHAATNLQYAIVEFDHFNGNIWNGVTQGLAFLQGRGFRS